ncbi:MAG TPA: caspase domain-containing protein [Bacteroidales bacterium]|nr:caspase domain-containing protein [Bacteroidales bacterium]HPJ60046.1 caspase domain-containing protein [Bacteroidales bacterium]HPR11465.1 caspase domain-containing protein [Bacteroidales bacterium]HRW86564.1 caspase domain-containing protein [Bacteroidales bacterium]
MKRYLIHSLLVFLVAFPLSGQSTTKQNIQQEKRLALVIGNGNYIGSTLANPENDARAMTIALQKLGFEVLEFENLDQNLMKKAIDDFGMRLRNYDVGLFYYAGHGIQVKGMNYLIPVDAQLVAETQVEFDCVQADRVVSFMDESGAEVKIVILDACRDNPFERSWTRSTTGRGLATMTAPSGTLIAYATAPGKTASDGSGKNGLYTSALLDNISIPNITALQMFQNVRGYVVEKSNKQQIPWESTSLTGDFYFNTVLTTEDAILKENVPVKSITPDGDENKNSPARTPLSDTPQDDIRITQITKKSVKSKPERYLDNNDSAFYATVDRGYVQKISIGTRLGLFQPKYYVSPITGIKVPIKPEIAGYIDIKSTGDLVSEGRIYFKDKFSLSHPDSIEYFARIKKIWNSIYVLTRISLNSAEKFSGEVDDLSIPFSIELGYMFTWVYGLGLYGEFGFNKYTSFLEDNEKTVFSPAAGGGIAKTIGRKTTLRLGASAFPTDAWYTATIDLGFSRRLFQNTILVTGLSFNLWENQQVLSLGLGGSF